MTPLVDLHMAEAEHLILLLKSLLMYWVFYLFFFSQHSASLSIVGFSDGLEMELPSTRSSSSADPQMQGAAAVTLGPSADALCDRDTPPESVTSYSLVLGRAPGDLSPGAAAGLAPGDTLQGSTKCKVGITQTPLAKGNLLSLIAYVIVSQSIKGSYFSK